MGQGTFKSVIIAAEEERSLTLREFQGVIETVVPPRAPTEAREYVFSVIRAAYVTRYPPPRVEWDETA